MNSQTAALSRNLQGAPAPASWPAGVAHAAIAWVRHWWHVRETEQRLTELDDKMLADIGLMRDQVRYMARRGRLPDCR